MSNNNIVGNVLTAVQLAVLGYIGYLAFLKRDAIKSAVCLLPGFNEQPFCNPASDPDYDPTKPGSGDGPQPGTNPYLPGDAACRTKQDCEARGGFWVWLGPYGWCLGGNCDTDPTPDPTPDPDPVTPKDCSSHVCMPGGVPYRSTDGSTCLCDYSNKPKDPVYTSNSQFKMTRVEMDMLPEKIIGWSEAFCSDPYGYKPPAGYHIESCIDGGPENYGKHGGCPTCAMALVTVAKGEMTPWDPDPTPDPDPYVPPASTSKCGNRFTGQESCANTSYLGEKGLIALTDEEKVGYNRGHIINATYACDPETGEQRRYWCATVEADMCGSYRCDVVMDYRRRCAEGSEASCNWLRRFAPDYAI